MRKDENSDLQRYYSRRVREYETIYNRDDPVRQGELAALGKAMRAVLPDRCVLEVACGTGYWTQIVAASVYVPGSGGKLVSRPGIEDTYKIRELADRSTDEVLKNYYDKAQLQSIFGPRARGRRIHMGKCFWWFDYRII